MAFSGRERKRGTHGRDLLARSEIRTFGHRAATTFRGEYEDLNILQENYRLAGDDEWEVEIEF